MFTEGFTLTAGVLTAWALWLTLGFLGECLYEWLCAVYDRNVEKRKLEAKDDE